MTTAGSFSSELRDLYSTESARTREDFAATPDGWSAISYNALRWSKRLLSISGKKSSVQRSKIRKSSL